MTEATTPVVETDKATETTDADLPEKYRGKSAAEIARMHAEAEKLIGRQGSKIGELEARFAAELAVREPERTPDDVRAAFSDDPQAEVQRAVAKAITPLKVELEHARFEQKHPDYLSVKNDPAFQAFVTSTPYRQTLYQRGNARDYLAADELLTLYKEHTKQSAAQAREARADAAASGTVAAATNTAVTGKGKVYNGADLRALMLRNPSEYARVWPEIEKAYREGRVRN